MSSVLSFGICFFVTTFWWPLCVHFYVLGRTAASPGLGGVALCSRYSVGSSGTASPINHWAYQVSPRSHADCVQSLVLESWLFLVCQWKVFTLRPISCIYGLWPPTTVEDHLCRGPSHKIELTSAGFGVCWACPLSVSFMGVVLWHGLKVSTVHAGSWTSWEVWAKVCVLLRATQHGLQSNLKMAATSAGFGSTWDRPSCEPSPAVTSARHLGPLREVQGATRPDVACLREFWKVCSMR